MGEEKTEEMEGERAEEKESEEIEKKEEEKEEQEETEEEIIEKRGKKIAGLFKKTNIWVLAFLIMALILGVYIRSLPMQDHTQGIPSLTKFVFTPRQAFGGTPGLWDITTNTWTLGPDLDPFLFLRYAKTIVGEGSLPRIDMMRNVPLGFHTKGETQVLPYMIAGTYWIFNIFSDVNVDFAGAVFPVIMFALTIIVFFLFVREIFVRKDKASITKANIIALISSFFMIVIPTFLSRTVAGIPEKESAAFFFMFLAFYLFLKAWKSENLKFVIVLGILSGIATGLMGLVWGGVTYIFVAISIATLIAFILNKIHRKEVISYALWILVSSSLMIIFSRKFSLIGVLTSLSTGLSISVLLIFIVHFILWNTKLSELKILRKQHLPKNIVSLIVTFILGILIVAVLFGPSFIVGKLKALNQLFFNPTTGRWGVTVAENRQPFFTEWGASFGPFLKKVPVLFWLFFIGSVVLFKDMLHKIKKKDAWILTFLYIFFFFGLVFSRYSGSSLFNGSNFISKAFYYLPSALLAAAFIYYYVRYFKEGNREFEAIDYEYLLLFSLFALCLFTARSAVRLIMVLAPVAPIFVGYLITSSIYRFRKVEDETVKIILGLGIILILVLSMFTFWTFYKSIKGQAYSFIPSHYTQQWQKGMKWVRENTPEDAVFSHWWDYGYWVQTIGNRATVLDGGNAIAYWNYLIGRLVLTGDNQEDALEFLYNHNATHLLIDSTDIGKYTAFSSIGSNEDYDRYSWMGSFLLDERQTRETKNQTTYVYSGGIALDEDLVIEENGKQILFPGKMAGAGAIILPIEKIGGGSNFVQPSILVVYQGQQHRVNLRYLYINEGFIDFGSGIEAAAYIFPRVIQQGQGLNQNPIGAAMYLSPRLMRGMLSQVYLLNDPLHKFPNFGLVHTEPNLIIDSLNSQGMNLPDFVFFQGVQGPIKIWEIEYTGEEEIKEEYLDKDYSKYISWRL